MKVAYFGMDALIPCLEVLLHKNYEVVKIFTMEDDPYDKTSALISLAKELRIPVQTSKVSFKDIEELEEKGVSLSVTAGYAYKIPISTKIKQLNIHPAYLPCGRGPWPMPVAILKKLDSGVTIHKLSEEFDRGDILIKQKIEIKPEDDLVTLEGKIKTLAPILLDEVLDDLEYYERNCEVQGEGSYFLEPTDLDRTILETDDFETIKLKDRAFKGYGLLKEINGVPFVCELQNDKLVSLRPYFKKLKLSEVNLVDAIRLKYQAKLSDYLPTLLYCWQNVLDFEICLGKDFYLAKSKDFYFFPIGDKLAIKTVLDFLRSQERIDLRFLDNKQVSLLKEIYPEAQEEFRLDDSDYVYVNEDLVNFHGPHLIKRRNDYHHFENLEPRPYSVDITKDNLAVAKKISYEAYLLGSSDYEAEKVGFDHFFELGLEGVLIYKDEEAIGYAIRKVKDKETLEGHFCKCLDKTRGGTLFTIVANTLHAGDELIYTNMEDDMGDLGLRIFKHSLNPILVKSYNCRLEMK